MTLARVFFVLNILSTLSLRRATTMGAVCRLSILFLSTPPCGERPAVFKPPPFLWGDFIHALLAESDPQHEHYNPGRIPISIHAPLAGSDCQRVHCGRCPRNFYPRSPCGERQYDPELYTPYALIFLSTLSLRRATNSACCGVRRKYILSTLSLRRATRYTVRHSGRSNYFYPRSPCGERHWAKVIFRYLGIISIHALLCGERP